jgi:flagellar basal-body rod modification protein FlgD
MATNSISAIDSLAGLTSGEPKASTTLSDANASQDRFLKLLVAQLQNQDPMSPMDNAQMTSQMAQINTVSGITQLNETMKSMVSQLAATQAMQGASMIGHDVLVSGNSLSIEAGVAKGAFDLSGVADKVALQITTPGGQLIEEINLGLQSAGRHDFQWDASKYTGTSNPSFKIVATNQGVSVSSTPLTRATVTSIATNGAELSLQLKGRESVAYSAIQAIL